MPQDIRVHKAILDKNTKAQETKGNTDKWDSIKLKHFPTSKKSTDIICRVEENICKL